MLVTEEKKGWIVCKITCNVYVLSIFSENKIVNNDQNRLRFLLAMNV